MTEVCPKYNSKVTQVGVAAGNERATTQKIMDA
jgi:hypothetical protein